jgi:hypothetical protein
MMRCETVYGKRAEEDRQEKAESRLDLSAFSAFSVLVTSCS